MKFKVPPVGVRASSVLQVCRRHSLVYNHFEKCLSVRRFALLSSLNAFLKQSPVHVSRLSYFILFCSVPTVLSSPVQSCLFPSRPLLVPSVLSRPVSSALGLSSALSSPFHLFSLCGSVLICSLMFCLSLFYSLLFAVCCSVPVLFPP